MKQSLVASTTYVLDEDPIAGMLAKIAALDQSTAQVTSAAKPENASPLYARQVDFLREALQETYVTPSAPGDRPRAGVGSSTLTRASCRSYRPPIWQQRLDVLPQSYLAGRPGDQ